ncbi:hypothetical protein HDK90DRAFT_465386 [Phyllosticta capitalensis]|uniref:Uncharacterized protein n=1 Tax=Phyllosticta capitalensis TaxID=121624 RepID=A0ABR1YUZ2_9PEZI
MRITTLFAAILAAFTSLVHGWEDDCKGSTRTLGRGECGWALNTIVNTTTYVGGDDFSQLECMIQYRTGGFRDQPLLGEVIKQKAQEILWYCPDQKGSFGTGNCPRCRVTINWRDGGCARKWGIATGTRFWPPWPFRKGEE